MAHLTSETSFSCSTTNRTLSQSCIEDEYKSDESETEQEHRESTNITDEMSGIAEQMKRREQQYLVCSQPNQSDYVQGTSNNLPLSSPADVVATVKRRAEEGDHYHYHINLHDKRFAIGHGGTPKFGHMGQTFRPAVFVLC